MSEAFNTAAEIVRSVTGHLPYIVDLSLTNPPALLYTTDGSYPTNVLELSRQELDRLLDALRTDHQDWAEPMPTGDAFIDTHFDPNLVSEE